MACPMGKLIEVYQVVVFRSQERSCNYRRELDCEFYETLKSDPYYRYIDRESYGKTTYIVNGKALWENFTFPVCGNTSPVISPEELRLRDSAMIYYTCFVKRGRLVQLTFLISKYYFRLQK